MENKRIMRKLIQCNNNCFFFSLPPTQIVVSYEKKKHGKKGCRRSSQVWAIISHSLPYGVAISLSIHCATQNNNKSCYSELCKFSFSCCAVLCTSIIWKRVNHTSDDLICITVTFLLLYLAKKRRTEGYHMSC